MSSIAVGTDLESNMFSAVSSLMKSGKEASFVEEQITSTYQDAMLLIAAKDGNVDLVASLLQKNKTLAFRNNFNKTILEAKDLETVKTMLQYIVPDGEHASHLPVYLLALVRKNCDWDYIEKNIVSFMRKGPYEYIASGKLDGVIEAAIENENQEVFGNLREQLPIALPTYLVNKALSKSKNFRRIMFENYHALISENDIQYAMENNQKELAKEIFEKVVGCRLAMTHSHYQDAFSSAKMKFYQETLA